MQVYVYHAHLCEIYAFCGVFIIRASLKTPFEKKQLCTTSAASTSLGVRQHAFNGMADNTAFAQTNIYKNGKLYDYLVAGVKTGGSGSNTTQNQWIDYEFDLNGESAVYELECIDVCGNISQKSSYKVTPDNTNNLADEKNANAEKPVNWEFTDIDHIEYTISGDSIRITGFDNTVENLVIPDKIEGLPVTVIVFNESQFRKAYSPTLVQAFGIVISVIDLQPLNALCSITARFSGRFIPFSFGQLKNAYCSIEYNDFGIFTFSSAVQ